MDSLEYLAWCVKKNKYFDVIVADPPSFARSKKNNSVFRVASDMPALLASCAQVLAPGGVLFASTNYSGSSLDDLRQKMEFALRGRGFASRLLFQGGQGPDFTHAGQGKESSLSAVAVRHFC
jgi:23S rRNA G2069 N7-methylase RlmK/C1962 C5-methylase RlmI